MQASRFVALVAVVAVVAVVIGRWANELLRLLAARYGATVAHLHRIFWVFPFFCLLTPGVEPVERAFKGVQFVHITLGFVCISH